jgi:large subunit ribosomal protein L15
VGKVFTPPNRVEFNEVNLEMLERFDGDVEITPEVLAEANLLSKKNNPVVILATEKVSNAYKVKVHRISKRCPRKN